MSGDAFSEADALAETVEISIPQAVTPARQEVARGPEEVFPLWRQRLRLAAMVLLAGSAVLLCRRVLQTAFGPSIDSAADWLLFWCHAAVTAILGLFSVLLFSRQPSSLSRLVIAEAALFGLPAVLFLASQYFLTLRSCEEFGVFSFPVAPWVILALVYALFIPSTLARASVVIGTITMLPVVLLLGMYLLQPSVALVVTLDDFMNIVLVSLLVAIGGVIGVNKIELLQREASRAKQLGQYRLTRRLGSGGMGDVFLAEHEMLKRPCVVKLIRPDKVGDENTLARFHREVQTTARLSHWNTVEILDYGRTQEGTFYYVMEYLPGMTMAEMVQKYGPLLPERAIYFLLQLCDALREAHEAGFVHRDVKPENIIIAQRGGVHDVAKILDFGLVEPIARAPDPSSTDDGLITGSPLFMSPEQAGGGGVADPRTDIYSLAAVAYYMLTGQPPFVGRHVVELVHAHLRMEPVPVSQVNSQVPRDLEQVIHTCLAKNPDDRVQDMTALAQLLARCEVATSWSRACAAQWWRERAGAA